MATGSKSARMTPADGDAFFTSAMTMIQPGCLMAAEKGRAGGRLLTRRSSSISGTARFAASISRSLVSTIRSRMVGMRRLAVGGKGCGGILDPVAARARENLSARGDVERSRSDAGRRGDRRRGGAAGRRVRVATRPAAGRTRAAGVEAVAGAVGRVRGWGRGVPDHLGRGAGRAAPRALGRRLLPASLRPGLSR